MINLICSTCYYEFDVDDHCAGQMAPCPNCGTQVAVPLQAGSAPVRPAKKFNDLSVLGFVFGLVGLFTAWCCIATGLPCGAAAIACGIFGFRAARKTNGNAGLAIAAMVLGGIDLLLGIAFLIFAIATG